MYKTPIRDKNKVKIFVLYLMHNIHYPMTKVQINDIVMVSDYVFYLDFAESFNEMLDGDLIAVVGKDENGFELYEPTQKGMLVADALHCDIKERILDESLVCALRYLDFQRRDVKVDTEFVKLPDTTFNITMTMSERGKIIFKTTINVDSEFRMHESLQTFRDRPDVVYRGMIALLAGRVNYLFDDRKFPDITKFQLKSENPPETSEK